MSWRSAYRPRWIDKPIAGLLADLKRTGLLDETLVVWAGEFGRSPDNGIRRGGVKAGSIVGSTDEVGGAAAEVVRPLRDFHVTLLHLLGLDDAKLRYFHAGREKQLSQVGGQVIRELLA